MRPEDKARVGEAFGDAYAMEAWLAGWENSLPVVMKAMEAKAKKGDATEKGLVATKRMPAAKKAQKDVAEALGAVRALMGALSDANLAKVASGEEFLKLHGAGATVLVQGALNAVRALDAVMLVGGGKRYMDDEGRSRTLWTVMPNFEKALAKMLTGGEALRTPLRPVATTPVGKPGNAPSNAPGKPVPPVVQGGKPVPPPKSGAAAAVAKGAKVKG